MLTATDAAAEHRAATDAPAVAILSGRFRMKAFPLYQAGLSRSAAEKQERTLLNLSDAKSYNE